MNLINIFKKITAGLLSASLLLGPVSLAAENTDIENMQEVYQDELAAKEIYSQMIDKFDNDEFYQRIYDAEINHEIIMERLINSYGEDVEEGDFSSIEVNDDELQALKDAYEFELADVKDLENRIENTDNQDEIRAYEKLLFGSTNHARALEKAIEAYESGDTDLNSLQLNMQNGQRKNDGRGQIRAGQGRADTNNSQAGNMRNPNNNCINGCDQSNRASRRGNNKNSSTRNNIGGSSQNSPRKNNSNRRA